MKYLAFLLPLIATPAAAADQMTILLDWFVNPDHGPIIVAQQQGYFAAEGLEVTIQPPADPADPPKLVAAGQADLAVSYQPQLHLLVAEGMPVKRVGTLIDNPLNCLLVLADGPVKQIADLKGRKIGFSVGGVEDAVLGSILTGAGLSLDDVELVNVNWSLSPALMAGQVDAVIGAYRNFELNQMLIEGRPGHCFAVEEVGVPIYDELIYLANPATMDAGRTARFLRATAKAAAFIAADPQAGWESFASYAPELRDDLNTRAWGDTLPHFAADPTAFDAERYAAFAAFMADSGLIPAGQTADDLTVQLVAAQ